MFVAKSIALEIIISGPISHLNESRSLHGFWKENQLLEFFPPYYQSHAVKYVSSPYLCIVTSSEITQRLFLFATSQIFLIVALS